jgi:tetratricopeptide (TPR) repeat protein
MVTAPLTVLLYDRMFLAKSSADLIQRRALVYLGLAATFSVLVLCGVVGGVLSITAKNATVGFSVNAVTPWQYLISQPGAIAYYLRLSFWPHPLCLDYNWPTAERLVDVLAPALVIIPLVVGIVWGLLRKPWVGFVGAAFFIILAPTSSFIPIKDLLFEHRMYLPLAAVVVVVVSVVFRGLLYLQQRRVLDAITLRIAAAVLLFAVVTPLTYGTILRNKDYHDALGMWKDVVNKRPNNHRAHLGYGTAVFALGDKAKVAGDTETARKYYAAAENAFQTAVDLNDRYADAWYNLGNAKNALDKPLEAIQAYQKSMQYRPTNAKAHYNLANVLKDLKRYDEAVTEYQLAIKFDPEHIKARVNLGNTLKVLRRIDEAIQIYLEALEIVPTHANTHHNLGDAYFMLGDYERALSEFQLALEYNPSHKHALRGRDATLARLRQLRGE